jgi:hypothetical protein
MVVVVARGANGSEVGVVVVTGLGSKSISKQMVGGEKKHLLHTTTSCVDQYGKVCVKILRPLSTQHFPN